MNMRGTPTCGRMAHHIIPATPKKQTVTGKPAAQQATPEKQSPSIWPTHGMQSSRTSHGLKQRAKANHSTRKPRRRKMKVVAWASSWSLEKNSTLFQAPSFNSPTTVPEQSRELGAFHFPTTPWVSEPAKERLG